MKLAKCYISTAFQPPFLLAGTILTVTFIWAQTATYDRLKCPRMWPKATRPLQELDGGVYSTLRIYLSIYMFKNIKMLLTDIIQKLRLLFHFMHKYVAICRTNLQQLSVHCRTVTLGCNKHLQFSQSDFC